MMKRILLLSSVIILSTALILLLTACGDSGGGGTGARAVPNAERIQSDIATNAISPIPNNRKVDSIEIINEDTDTDTGQHSATVRVFSNDSEVAYTENMRVVYIRNEDREWVLSAITPDSSVPVLMSPLVGANVSLVREAIIGANLIIDDEEWVVDENNLESVTIASQDTNLEQNRDTVTVNVELKDVVLSADGQMQVEFRFNNGVWEHSEYRVSTVFETSILPHAVLDVTDNELLTILVRHNVTYSPNSAKTAQDIMMEKAALDLVGALTGMPFLSALLGGGDSGVQTMSISDDEISDFAFIDSVSSEKGTIKTFFSSFLLSKELVDFEVFSQVIYYFDPVNGWGLQDVGFTSIVNEVKLDDTNWVGTYQIQGIGSSTQINPRLTMTVTDITRLSDIDGSIEVIINLYPTIPSGTGTTRVDAGDWRQTAKGFINFVELTFELNFDEWIVAPPLAGSSVSRQVPDGINISGRIDVENSSFSGTRRAGVTNLPVNLSLTDEVFVTDQLEEHDDDENDDD